MKIKTSELIGVALDWAVAQACGVSIRVLDADNPDEKWQTQLVGYPYGPWRPSQDWSQGGPLIERLQLTVMPTGGADYRVVCEWYCGEPLSWHPIGSSYLVAAMRAIISVALGDEVDVPDVLSS